MFDEWVTGLTCSTYIVPTAKKKIASEGADNNITCHEEWCMIYTHKSVICKGYFRNSVKDIC